MKTNASKAKIVDMTKENLCVLEVAPLFFAGAFFSVCVHQETHTQIMIQFALLAP